MSSVSKGRAFELEVKKILEKDGWLVWRTTRTRFGANDLFGIFDLACLRPTISSCELMYISCSYITHKSDKLNELQAFCNKYHINAWLSLKVPAGWKGRGKNKKYQKASIETIQVIPNC